MKSFSTVRDTWRGTHSYMEKRRGRREMETTRRRRGGIKKGESKLASNHFPMCSPQSGFLRDVHRVKQRKEEGGRRQRCPGGEKGESKGERQMQPVISSLLFSTGQNTQRDSQSWVEKRRGREEIEATWWRKRRIQSGREPVKPVILLPSKNGY